MKTAFQNNLYMLKKIFRLAPGYAIWQMLNTLLDAIVIFLANTYIYRFVASCMAGGVSFGVVTLAFGFLTALLLIYLVSDGLFTHIGKKKMQLILSYHMEQELYQKAVKIDIEYYDDPEYYNDFIMAASQAREKSAEVLDATVTLINDILVALLHGILFVALDMTGMIIIAVSLTLSLLLQKKVNRAWSRRETQSKPLQRECDYVQRVFYLKESAKEIRLFPLPSLLAEKFLGVSQRLRKKYQETGGALCLWSFISSYFGEFFYFLLYIWEF